MWSIIDQSHEDIEIIIIDDGLKGDSVAKIDVMTPAYEHHLICFELA